MAMSDSEYDKAQDIRNRRAEINTQDTLHISEAVPIRSLAEYISLASIPFTELNPMPSELTIAAYRYEDREDALVRPAASELTGAEHLELLKKVYRDALVARFESPERDYALADILLARLLELNFGSKLTYGVLAAITALLTVKKDTDMFEEIDHLHIDFVNAEITIRRKEEEDITTGPGLPRFTEDNIEERQMEDVFAYLDELAEEGDARAEKRNPDQILADASNVLQDVGSQIESFIAKYSVVGDTGKSSQVQAASSKPLEKLTKIASILSNWESAIQELCDLFTKAEQADDVKHLENNENFWEVIEGIVEKAYCDVEELDPVQSKIEETSSQRTIPAQKAHPSTLDQPELVFRTAMQVRERMSQAYEQMTLTVIKAMIEGDSATADLLTSLMMRRCNQRMDEIVAILQQKVTGAATLNAGQWTASHSQDAIEKPSSQKPASTGYNRKERTINHVYQGELWNNSPNV